MSQSEIIMIDSTGCYITRGGDKVEIIRASDNKVNWFGNFITNYAESIIIANAAKELAENEAITETFGWPAAGKHKDTTHDWDIVARWVEPVVEINFNSNQRYQAEL